MTSRPRRLWPVVAAGALVALAALFVAVPLAKRAATRPELLGLDPAIGQPGSTIRVFGRNFGQDRDDGRVEFDGEPLTASSYLSWKDDVIEVRVPLYAQNCTVHVVTEAGRSNPRMFLSRDRLPVSTAGGGASSVGPRVDSLSVERGAIGSVLTIRGLNFGLNRDTSSVQFGWESAASVFSGGPDQDTRGNVTPLDEDGEYLSWSDKEIRVVVPDGAVSGSLSVRTDRGSSSGRYFEIVDMPGTKTYSDRRTYALRSFVSISRVQATPGNTLHLWLPFPASSAWQKGVKVLSRSHEPLVPEYRGLSVYRLGDLAKDKLLTVSQDFLVQVHAVSTDIKPERVKAPPSPAPPVYQLYTSDDGLAPSTDADVKAFAAKAAGRERNPYRVAKLLWDALLGAVEYDPAARSSKPAAALKGGKADAWDLSLLYVAMLRASGIPARPVAGILVDEDVRAWSHAWAEFYLYGFGWVPADPALGTGAAPGGTTPAFEDPKRYFGNLDARHVAYSRGLTRVSPMTPDSRPVGADRRYSMQTIYEEGQGNLTSYTSFWSDVEVTGVY